MAERLITGKVTDSQENEKNKVSDFEESNSKI
jgi:hypothetical protein